MKKKFFKKILWSTLSFLLLIIVVLGVHIYIMTAKAPTDSTKIMARIDFKQDITKDDANKITAWLYQQKGVDHVLCNEATNIIVFTIFPVKTNADNIIYNLKSHFHYKAKRYLPSENDLQSGCPIAANSLAYKIADFFKKTF